MKINYVYDKCSRCGANLKRFSIESIVNGFVRDGDSYSPGIICNKCGKRYVVSIIFHFIWFGLVFLSVQYFYCSGFVGCMLINFLAWVLGYLLAWTISPFKTLW